jgi:hypothetical protein
MVTWHGCGCGCGLGNGIGTRTRLRQWQGRALPWQGLHGNASPVHKAAHAQPAHSTCRYIPAFLDKQRQTGCDIVTGTRYIRGGGVSGWSMMRKTVSRGANLAASFLLGASSSDLTGAFRLYKRDVLSKLLSCTASTGYAFQMEVIIRAQYAGFHIEEVPIVFVDRLFGRRCIVCIMGAIIMVPRYVVLCATL